MESRHSKLRRVIRLDGEKMTDRESTHHYLAKRLQFPDYYGRNLDALYDLLSEIGEPTKIILYSIDDLKRSQPEYGRKLLKVLRTAEENNEFLKITFLDGLETMPQEFKLKIHPEGATADGPDQADYEPLLEMDE